MDNSSKTIYFGFHTYLVLNRTGPSLSVFFLIVKICTLKRKWNESLSWFQYHNSSGKGKLEGTWMKMVSCSIHCPGARRSILKSSLGFLSNLFLRLPWKVFQNFFKYVLPLLTYFYSRKRDHKTTIPLLCITSLLNFEKSERNLADRLEGGDIHRQKRCYESFSSLENFKLLLSDSWLKAWVMTLCGLSPIPSGSISSAFYCKET